MLHEDFELLFEQNVQEVSGMARLWQHKVTGAQILSISNMDENKCFGVTLRTPPPDSSGVAHILEHSVLCGSEKFKVREPFVELLKGSLQTFLNAFTFPDKTCYPVASTNIQDFYNLIDVYIDAVFHPLITHDTFLQEGWHVEAESADEPWTFKGVVYNEMKGVYSTPESVLAEQSQQSLFPDMLYSLDSGGAPQSILTLTYEGFKDFHKKYYHPSNARFFFWGDDSEAKRLQIVSEALKDYEAMPANSDIPLQKAYDMPRHIEVPYAISEDEDRAMFTVNWLLCETRESENALIFEMLEHILEGLPGSPLRKALIESGLGEDIVGIGLEGDLRQMYYSIGLKGVAPQNVQKAEMLIFDTLAGIVEAGIEAEVIDAAVNSVEFALRENNSGRFPRGLSAMVQSLSTWLYGTDPKLALTALMWEKPLANIKKRLAAKERIFEQFIEQWFLNNNHRSTVVLLPDANLGPRREEEERAKLARIQEACTKDEREALVQETLRLQKAQEKKDSPEALATIPSLTVADLPLKNQPLPSKEHGFNAARVLVHDLDTSGVAYVNLLLPLNAVPKHLMPLVPLLGRALTEMGTAKNDFVRMGMHIAAKTGGVWAAPFLATHRVDREPRAYFSIGSKVVRDKVSDAFEIMHELLFEPNFDQKDRFYQMLLEAKARLEHGLLSAGHALVSSRIRARYSQTGWLEELTGSVSYYEYILTLIVKVQSDWASVLSDLQELYTLILAQDGCIMDCTADATTLGLVEAKAQQFVQSLPHRDVQPASWGSANLPSAQVFTAPLQINFVGKGANVYDLGYKYHGSAQVISRYLRMGYLWEKVRVQGGAYGVFCALDRLSGVLVQASYRDPSVLETIKKYDGTVEFLRNFNPDSRELSSAIVGAIGDLDTYMLPDAKGAAALSRYLCADSDDARQQMRDEILSTTAKDFKAFADVMEQVAKEGSICILGGSAAEEAGKAQGFVVSKLL